MFSISHKEMKRRMVFTNLDEVRAELGKMIKILFPLFRPLL